MKIDNNSIKYIANLAMIEIGEDEEEKYSTALEQILTYAEILDNMDMSIVNSFKSINTNKNRFRDDEVIQCRERGILIKNAEETEKGMFKVPKVL